MATGKSKLTTGRFKCLSTVILGGNEIRFVGMNEENNGVHFPKDVNYVSTVDVGNFGIKHLFTAFLKARRVQMN
jgi:hypothetical protein